ncbi:hypothetical protein NDU88_001423, partial [Pleurodeles waltl]
MFCFPARSLALRRPRGASRPDRVQVMRPFRPTFMFQNTCPPGPGSPASERKGRHAPVLVHPMSLHYSVQFPAESHHDY